MQATPPEFAQARENFLSLVADLRPALHRYCARLTGSVIDGEDIVQETLARAFYALSLSPDMPALRPWLFRTAHNAAIDYLRRYERIHAEPRAAFDDTAAPDDAPDPAIVEEALARFVSLPVLQRSAVILKDVLGHSLAEVADTMQSSIPAVKAALVRGRAALQATRGTSAETAPLDPAVRAKLQQYAALFNAKNWDGLRAVVTDECHLDLVSKAARRGKQIHGYFARYAAEPEARLVVGLVDGRPALGLCPRPESPPAYFVLLDWEGERLANIRDFRYVPYIAQEASAVFDLVSNT
jgi:RNA polymerase sigma-70 factor (ECF subfamily)